MKEKKKLNLEKLIDTKIAEDYIVHSLQNHNELEFYEIFERFSGIV